MALPTLRHKLYLIAGFALLASLMLLSLFIGRYPLSVSAMLSGDSSQLRVFYVLRLSRTLVAVIGGFALGVSGYVYQTVFRNPLASPDIIGVSSGASAGAAAGILFFSTATSVTIAAFIGALSAVILALSLSSLDSSGRKSTIVLSGIAVHALAQTALMALKLTADPQKELASIEYWIMGSLSDISIYRIGGNLILCLACTAGLFLLHRHLLLLSAEEGEARMLGLNVTGMRFVILGLATLTVAAIVSMTGLISFIGLLAPHGARLLTGNHHRGTLLLSGLLGGCLLTGADLLARSAAGAELPVSIFTSLLGAPFLLYLVLKGRRESDAP